MNNASLRIAVIGAGNHFSLHHGNVLKLYAAAHPGELDLSAVCDLDAGKAGEYAKQFGFARTYTDYRTMLEDERLDAIVALTPVHATAAVATDLLPRGIPLLIEKPTGESAADTRRLLAMARKRGAPHMVSFNRRSIPAIVRAREWLAQQGPRRAPRLVVGRMLRPDRTDLEFVTETAIHLIDTVPSFTGMPRKVVTGLVPTPLPDRWLSNTLLDFGEGVSAMVTAEAIAQVGEVSITLEA
jgi:predicted dehydrogenase